MLFAVYWGDPGSLSAWSSCARAHGRWLGLGAKQRAVPLSPGAAAAVCLWDGAGDDAAAEAAPSAGEDRFVLVVPGGPEWTSAAASAQAFQQAARRHADTNRAVVGLTGTPPSLSIQTPPAGPDHFFYCRDGRGLLLSNDMRVLVRWRGIELDERGLYSLLQFGAVPPPFSLCAGIGRIVCGHRTDFPSPEGAPRKTRSFLLPAGAPKESEQGPAAERLTRVLTDTLADVPDPAALYFSGGIDSTLIAIRLAQCGRRDVKLVNFSFGADDAEAVLASEAAAHLGLPMCTVRNRPTAASEVLPRLARDYSFPFADISVVPTNLLVRESLPCVEDAAAVLDGTGADGAFAVGLKFAPWRRLYGIPRWLGGALSGAYRLCGLWRFKSPAETLGRLVRRRLAMSIAPAAVMAKNALDGIAYAFPGEVRAEVLGAVAENVEGMFEGLDPREQMSMVDVVHVCAGQFAVKTHEPLKARGLRAVYPFLEPPMLRCSAELEWDLKARGGEPKWILKQIVAAGVPAEWVFRPKSGFSAPVSEIFADAGMSEFVADFVLSSRNPVSGCLDLRRTARMFADARAGKALSIGVRNFLWSVVFTSAWLRQIDGSLREDGPVAGRST
ncbi:asparagine synthase-related protein [Verrucomicrobiota bacterium]